MPASLNLTSASLCTKLVPTNNIGCFEAHLEASQKNISWRLHRQPALSNCPFSLSCVVWCYPGL